MSILKSALRIVKILFLCFILWLICIVALMELNLRLIISDTLAAIFVLIVTIWVVILFTRLVMRKSGPRINMKLKPRVSRNTKKTTREPRLNRYVDNEAIRKSKHKKIVSSILIVLLILPRNVEFAVSGVILLGIIWFIIGRTTKKEYLMKNSERIRELEKINTEYSSMINDYNEIDYITHKFTTKRAYDNRNETLIFYQYLIDSKSYVKGVFEKIKENRSTLTYYEYQLKRIDEIQPIKKYSELEASIVRSKILKIKTDYQMVFTYSYTSAKGRNQLRNKVTYSYDEIVRATEVAHKELQKQENFEYTREQERLKMTRSMRYDVLVRDRFTCQICGASREDGVRLHVDHIYPISKGGKTTMKNLQTLCEDCNVGKWNKVNWSNVSKGT